MERAASCLISLVLMTATACAGVAEEGGTSSPSEVPAAKSEATPSELETLAVKALSERLSVPIEQIEVVSLTPIDWPDSSMGCPKPDFSYLQVITPGHVAELRHAGKRYQVHMAGGRAFVCDRAASGKPREKGVAPQPALSPAQAQTAARTDLARRLGVPVEEISVTKAEQVVWQDSSLGCPQPGQTYKANPTRGYRLNLSYHGREYAYHADRYRMQPCPPFVKD